MNNISFGSERVGYYETVAGGAGAGPGWNGRSGVHSHMTNTRITDPEILEKRWDESFIQSGTCEFVASNINVSLSVSVHLLLSVWCSGIR